jgi:urease accessory protein
MTRSLRKTSDITVYAYGEENHEPSMFQISAIVAAGTWDPTREIDQVLIDYDRRFRRRIVLTTVTGTAVLIDLPGAVRLRDGDGLATESGCVIRVRAQPEPLLEIHAHDEGELVRIAWHLGNRHLPVQLFGDRIRIRDDHVIKAMVEGLGGHVEVIEAPFDPEAGAYAAGGHGHAHDDDDDHRHT